jgi:predicted RecA/RadA family phage recombinase
MAAGSTGNTTRPQASSIEYVGKELAFTAGGAISTGAFVYLSANNTVTTVSTMASQAPIGQAISSASAAGESVAVATFFDRIFNVVAKGGTLNANTYVKPNGTVSTASGSVGFPEVVAVAVTDPKQFLVLQGGAADATIRIAFIPQGYLPGA